MKALQLKMIKYLCANCSSPTIILGIDEGVCRCCFAHFKLQKNFVGSKYKKILLKINKEKLLDVKIRKYKPTLNSLFLEDTTGVLYKVNIGNKTSRHVIGYLSCNSFQECLAAIQTYKLQKEKHKKVQSLVIKKVY